MNQIKTDLFPEQLRAGKKKEREEKDYRKNEGQADTYRNAAPAANPLPESTRPRKDGPGGE